METAPTSAVVAYERLAPFYDELTREHDYEAWTGHLERAARRAGLRGRRLLDAACGTGKSFMPFLGRGYEVMAFDVSPEMVALARAKAPEADLFVEDLRSLPAVGEFDLITCLDDSLNYLTGDGELDLALAGLARNLAPGGVLVFDLNTISTYRTAFARDTTLDGGGVFLAWRGGCSDSERPGCIATLTVEAFRAGGSGHWERVTSIHRQRHHTRPEVERALATAGLAATGVFGQLPDGSLDPAPSEEAHHKLVYLARPQAARGGENR
jgi:SAM-dependent methyltransferase